MQQKKIYEAHNKEGRYSEMSVCPTITRYFGTGGGNVPLDINHQRVRHLTPLECERLQGFPDNWTDIEWKGKSAPDSARYKAIGNSMAVPVMRWIAERILTVEGKGR